MTPTVSVVIAAFDAERFLAETLDSVIAQDHPALEIVLVDDGSPTRRPPSRSRTATP
jgi:glycosyltransferase involved in cell wall biosynthesis